MLLFADVDNTLIYSRKRLQSIDDMVCVEKIDNELFSFMPIDAYNKVSALKKDIVPISTRTIEQYNRLLLPEFDDVLLNNGGILMRNGVMDVDWVDQSMHYALECKDVLSDARRLLKKDRYVTRAVDFIDSMFIFTKSSNIEQTYNTLIAKLGDEDVDIECQGCKIYVFPKKLSKGYAVRRYLDNIRSDTYVLAAGDNHLDFSMADEVDLFITSNREKRGSNVVNIQNSIFVDDILNHL